MRNNIKTLILNFILTETEKVLIKNGLHQLQRKTYGCIGESIRDMNIDLYKLNNKIKTKTKGDNYNNVD